MKLATLREGGRDGTLVVVDRALRRCARVPEIAPTLQAALDDWDAIAPRLEEVAAALEAGRDSAAESFDPAACAAPLPRAYQFADGSAYLSHVERVRRARGAALPEDIETDPLIYQGLSDGFLGPRDPIVAASEDHGIDLEAEVAVILDDVPMGTGPAEAGRFIRLVTIMNDVSLRNLIPGEVAKGFGFFQSKPASALAPVAATPDSLGPAWDGGQLYGALVCRVNEREIGRPDAGRDMAFDFPRLIAHAVRTRRLGAGTVIGSGTVSNRDRGAGAACLAELRALETIETGAPQTPFLGFGDRVRIELVDPEGRSLFGAIDQKVVPLDSPA